MSFLFNTSWKLKELLLSNQLIQGPLAGFSAAPFRELFYDFLPPAYSVSEMISAQDLIGKHALNSRYLFRSPKEKILCYQIAGNNPIIMAKAAKQLEDIGANIIDINCGCPKQKIRKKGAGSALLENPSLLYRIVDAVRHAISRPLTIKIRISENDNDFYLAQQLEHAGVDALIIHGRHWRHSYEVPCNFKRIQEIKKEVTIPVIANGDISDLETLKHVSSETHCDAFMISRASTGKPWIYQNLLSNDKKNPNLSLRKQLFLRHIEQLTHLENEHQAVLQSRKLIRYYFRELDGKELQSYYSLNSLTQIENYFIKT